MATPLTPLHGTPVGNYCTRPSFGKNLVNADTCIQAISFLKNPMERITFRDCCLDDKIPLNNLFSCKVLVTNYEFSTVNQFFSMLKKIALSVSG